MVGTPDWLPGHGWTGRGDPRTESTLVISADGPIHSCPHHASSRLERTELGQEGVSEQSVILGATPETRVCLHHSQHPACPGCPP